MAEAKRKKTLDDQLSAMATEFDDTSKPWNSPDLHAGEVKPKPKPRPAPLPRPKPSPTPTLQEDIQEKVANLKAVRKPYRKVGVAVDVINTGEGGAGAKEITDVADRQYKKFLDEEKAIEPKGAEARARKRMR